MPEGSFEVHPTPRSKNIRLAICHDAQSQRNSKASLTGWTPSSNGRDKLHQEFDLTILVRYQQGQPNGQEAKYLNFAQEVVEKHRGRQAIRLAQMRSTFTLKLNLLRKAVGKVFMQFVQGFIDYLDYRLVG